MKKYLCLLLAVFLLTGCTAAPPAETGGTTEAPSTTATTVPATAPTEPPEMHTVWLWTEKRVTYTEGSSVYKRTYDEKGNLLTDNYASNDGKAGNGSTYTYDTAGRMLTRDTYDTHSPTGHTEFTYDAADRLLTETFSDNEGHSGKTEFTYREDGLLTESFTAYDKTEDRTTYTYDEYGNLLKTQEIIALNGKVIRDSYVEYTYDESGNKLFQTDNRGFKKEWTYDDRENVLSYMEIDGTGRVWVGFHYEYDDQNRLLIEYLFEGELENPTEKYIYEYDEAGKLTTKYVCTPNSSKQNAHSSCSYTYDEHGNLLSEITTQKDGAEVSRIEYTYIAMELPVE